MAALRMGVNRGGQECTIRYRHMAFSAVAERHAAPDDSQPFPIAMLFLLAGNQVIRMNETRWPTLQFATNADAADFAATQCRVSIDAFAITCDRHPQ